MVPNSQVKLLEQQQSHTQTADDQERCKAYSMVSVDIVVKDIENLLETEGWEIPEDTEGCPAGKD